MRPEPLDPEVLAALLEGTLPADERDEVLERLAQSPDDYEAFVEAASVLRDLEEDAGAAPVAPPPPPAAPTPVREIRPARRWFHGPRLWLPLAAILAGVLVVQRVVLDDGGARAPVELLERDPLVRSSGSGSLALALGPEWDQPGWSVRRGGGQSLADARRDFRIGVRLADLDAALDAGDAQAVQRVAPELTGMVEQAGPGVGFLAAELQEIAALAAAPGPRRDPAREAGAAAELADLFQDAPWFGLGVWVGQARLAALAGRTDFFEDEAARRVLEGLIEPVAKQPGPGAPVARHLRGLYDRIRDGVSPGELEAIRPALAAIVRESGG